MAIIGGDVAAMESTAGRFDLTGTTAATEAETASAFARAQQGEYDALAASLVARITEAARSCRGEAERMRGELDATEWYGNARARVETAEAELRATLGTVVDDATTTAEQFKADLARLVAGYEEQVLRGRLAPAMERLRESYADAGRITRHVADGFRQADAAAGI